MGKSKKFNSKYDYDYDEEDQNHKQNSFTNKRKEKRINSALRSKNIDDLIELEDDYDY